MPVRQDQLTVRRPSLALGATDSTSDACAGRGFEQLEQNAMPAVVLHQRIGIPAHCRRTVLASSNGQENGHHGSRLRDRSPAT
jgi:hypothetical protein